MPTYFLIGSGSVDPLAYYQPILDSCDLIIGVDGGTNHLFSLKRTPHWVLGDNDSIRPDTLDWLQSKAVPLTIYPSEKDKSDFELAVDRLMEDSPKGRIYLAAMMGGRIDHTILNIQIAQKLLRAGFQPIFISEHTWIRLIKGGETIQGQGLKGKLLSLISLSDFIWIKQTIHLKYSLSDERIEKMSTRGLSNELLSDHFEVEMTEGEALLVYHSDKQTISPLLFQQGGKQ